MTGASLRDGLVRSGMAPDEAEAKHPLLARAIAAFEEFAGRPPDHAWWVPGRLEVLGKHTDYAGGRSVVCALPKGFVVLARGRPHAAVRVRDAIRHDELHLETHDATGTGTPGAGWRHYVRVVVQRLRRNFPGVSLGADIVVASDLPSASGMSSSSALLTGTARALADLADLRSHPAWQANIRTPEDEAGYYACIENGMTFGGLAGDSGVGTHGGSEDHAAIVCSRAGELHAWSFVPLRRLAGIRLPAGWRFVIAASGVAARKTGPAMESYNRLSREAAALLELWQRDVGEAPSLGSALASNASGPERLAALIQRPAGPPEPADRLERRLAQFVRENARVQEAIAAFRTGDRERVGRLAAASQADAEALLDNQVDETSALARSALEHGAFAASAFGAGFGGSVWALVDGGDAGAFAARWIAHYRARFPHRTAATVFPALPGPSLFRLI